MRYGPEYAIFVDLLAKIRRLTLGQGASSEEHKALVTRILQTNILALIKDKEWQQLHATLSELLPLEINVSDIVHKLCNE